jgi:hypothetical protein
MGAPAEYLARARCAQERPPRQKTSGRAQRKESLVRFGMAALREMAQGKKPCPDEGKKCVLVSSVCSSAASSRQVSRLRFGWPRRPYQAGEKGNQTET